MTQEKKDFYKYAWGITLPIVVQNLLSATISSTDVLMLNSVGQSAISAVSLATNVTSMLFMFLYGLGTGVTMLSSQYSGKGDYEAIHLVQGIALKFSLLLSVIVSALALFLPETMMKIFTNDPELTALGASYLRVVGLCYIFWGATEMYMSTLRSIGRVKICTVLSMGAFIANIILNAIFIYGWFGMPKMGVVGVAIGTTASRILQFIGAMVVSAKSKDVKFDFRYVFRNNKALNSDFARMALPAIINDAAWGLAFSLYSAIIGHLDNDAVAAYSVTNVVRNFGTVFCFAVGSASGIILGNEMGKGLLEKSRETARRIMWMTILAAVFGSAIIFALIPLVLRFASLNETAMHYLKYMMLINTYYVFGTAINTTLIAGVFRAGGNSRFGMICDIIDMWVYSLPMGCLAAFVFKLPVMWVYFILCTDEFVKWPWVLKYYFSGKWIKNITRDDLYEEDNAVVAKQ